MKIKGWVFKENKETLCKRNKDIYNKTIMEGKDKYIVVDDWMSGYGYVIRKGRLLKGHPPITEEELAIYQDKGNLCFGGECTITDDKFWCKIFLKEAKKEVKK